jgi:arsenate reductase
MAAVRIFHNPNCSNSRKAMAVAEELGVDAEVVQYLKSPPDREALQWILDHLEDPPTDLVRRDATFAELGLSDADVATADQVVEVLLATPKLMQRPVVIRGERAIIGRPTERVRDLLS